MSKINVLFFVYDSVSSMDLFGPLQVFECANIISQKNKGHEIYNISIFSVNGGQVRTSSGVTIETSCIQNLNMSVDTLIIPGGPEFEKASKDKFYTDLIKKLYNESQRTVSICNAAFILAECGLLDGKIAVTHWLLFELFEKRYPSVLLDSNSIFTNDGDVWTSAGIATGIDLCLELISHDCGRAFSLSIAKFLVVYLHRTGEEPQLSEYLTLQSKSDKFYHLLNWINNNLNEKIQTKTLSDRMNMSERSFVRHFTSEFGITPAKAVDEMRIQKVKFFLTETNYPLKKIAFLCGFYDEHLLRKKFYKRYNQKPLEYRKLFERGINIQEGTYR